MAVALLAFCFRVEIEQWNKCRIRNYRVGVLKNAVECNNGTVVLHKYPSFSKVMQFFGMEEKWVFEVNLSRSVTRLRTFPRSSELFEAMNSYPYGFDLIVDDTDFSNDDLTRIVFKDIRGLSANNTDLSSGKINIPFPQWLREVKVNNTKIGDEFILWASNQRSLGILDIANTNVTDEAITCINENRSLFSINVTGSRITPEGVAALKASFPKARVQAN